VIRWSPAGAQPGNENVTASVLRRAIAELDGSEAGSQVWSTS